MTLDFANSHLLPIVIFRLESVVFIPGLDTCPKDEVFELEVSKKESKHNGTHIKSILNPENEFVGLYIFFNEAIYLIPLTSETL